jgi:nucleoside-diphosphate-sugar epimerase
MRVLIVGCGYVGLPLGAELVRQGHTVFGLRRRAPAAAELTAAGITPLSADITRPETVAKLPCDFDWVVNCAASGGGGADDYQKIYLEGNRNLIAHLAGESLPHLFSSGGEGRGEEVNAVSNQFPSLQPSPRLGGERESASMFRLKKFVYTSSTSVYAQNDGSVVTELSPVVPEADTAKILVETEQLLLSSVAEHKFPAVILRVAGIYGPGRGHSFKQFLRGEARIEGDGSRTLNMIHRDDLIGVIIAALERGAPGEIYNAADDAPVSQADFFGWLAAELKQPLPPRVAADAEAGRKRGVTNKRVCNAKLRAELKYEFRFPDFRAGYAVELARVKS